MLFIDVLNCEIRPNPVRVSYGLVTLCLFLRFDRDLFLSL